MNDYKDQFTPQNDAATNVIQMYPDHFAGWKECEKVFIEKKNPSLMEVISADFADYEILKMVNSTNWE